MDDITGKQHHPIGIDLGTTNSCIATYIDGKPVVIPDDCVNQITPSFVCFDDRENNQITIDPKNTIYDVKRIIGRPYSDPLIQANQFTWPFTIVNFCGYPQFKVNVNGKTEYFKPEEVSAITLGRMKKIAEKFLGEEIVKCVITIPANFTSLQRQATLDAGKLAGLNVLRIIHEPSAAAIAYGFGNKIEGKAFLVFDFGGGTLDVTIVEIYEDLFDVRAMKGNSKLGGEDFDMRILKFLCSEFEKEHGVDLMKNKMVFQKLKNASEKAKKELSYLEKTTVEIPAVWNDLYLSIQITRPQFEDICADIFHLMLIPVKEVITQYKEQLTYGGEVDLQDIILVGGSTRIPKVRDILYEFFDRKPKFALTMNPEETVAMGAALECARLTGSITSLMELYERMPFSLGIKVFPGDRMSTIVERNHVVPAEKSGNYTTAADNQTIVTIEIFEGEGIFTATNTCIGTFTLQNIPKAPRGVPDIQVKFVVNTNGILTASAIERKCKESNEIHVSYGGRGTLKNSEIQELLKKSSDYQTKDYNCQTVLSMKNQLETNVSNTMKNIGSINLENQKLKVISYCRHLQTWLYSTESFSKSALEDKINVLKLLLESIPDNGKIDLLEDLNSRKSVFTKAKLDFPVDEKHVPTLRRLIEEKEVTPSQWEIVILTLLKTKRQAALAEKSMPLQISKTLSLWIFQNTKENRMFSKLVNVLELESLVNIAEYLVDNLHEIMNSS